MRVRILALLVLLVPTAAAEFGPYGDDGWPLAADGTSTNPFPGVDAHDIDALLADALAREEAGEPLNRIGGTTVYPYWPLLLAEVQRMAADHPDLVRLHTAGKSTLGLELFMLEIADFAAVEDGTGTPLDRREVVWVDGGTHSNEYSGVYFALAVAQFLVEEYDGNDTARWIVDNRHTWIMPMVNPDGSHAFGRLNAHGVNINRNYPVVWDGEGHDPLMNNRGPSPASEVETQVNIAWFDRTQPDYYASVHCCGNLWLYPYGEEGVDPLDQAMLQRVCDEALPSVREDCGPIWSTIYPASGSSVDTVYERTGAVAFGYEMSGRGAAALWGQPVTFEEVMVQERESWTALMHAFLHVEGYGARVTLLSAEAVGDQLVLRIRNDGLGPLPNGTVRVAGAEAALPGLGPGGTADVLLPVLPTSGVHAVVFEHPKRWMPTSNIAVRTATLAVGEDRADAVPDAVALRLPGEASAEVPAVPWAVLAVALVAVARVLRPGRRP